MSLWSRFWGSAPDPELSFSEFGFLWEAYKDWKNGKPGVAADTSSINRLVELGLIRITSPFPFRMSEITPLGRKVLLESVRKEEGEEAAKATEAWQPPDSGDRK